MNWNRPAWWPHFRRSRLSQEPGAALFHGVRVRLTLWYCAVLGTALILFGVVLYFGTQHFLIKPLSDDVQIHVDAHEQDWKYSGPYQACPLLGPQGPGPGFQMPELVVCFDQNGNLLAGESTTLPGESTTTIPSSFLTP
ncbi:MAG TPA: hypothetical protein VIZ18_12370, partial [Ktedonobacteraceae bacterium]